MLSDPDQARSLSRRAGRVREDSSVILLTDWYFASGGDDVGLTDVAVLAEARKAAHGRRSAYDDVARSGLTSAPGRAREASLHSSRKA